MSGHQQKLNVGGIRGTKKSFQNGWSRYWEESDVCHQLRLHRVQGAEYIERLEASIAIDKNARVLDFGCGFGFVAEALSENVNKVFVWDASDNMRNLARKRLAGRQNVEWLDLSHDKASPCTASVDLILINSVVQYMHIDELSSWMVRWRTMLAPGGRVIISDVIKPAGPSVFWEIYDLLAFSVRRGVLMHTLWLKRGHLSKYWETSASHSLTQISGDALRRLAAVAGLLFEILPANLTHFPGRYTAVLSK